MCPADRGQITPDLPLEGDSPAESDSLWRVVNEDGRPPALGPLTARSMMEPPTPIPTSATDSNPARQRDAYI